MQIPQYNATAASLAVATVVAAINPHVNGFFDLAIEVGDNVIVAISAQNRPKLEVFSYRVWTCDEDGNEVDIPFAAIDTDIIEQIAAI